MITEEKEEQLWFKNVKAKLQRRIANSKWDSLHLSNMEWDTIMFIVKSKNVNELPLLLNERIIDNLFKKIDTQFKQMKGKEL